MPNLIIKDLKGKELIEWIESNNLENNMICESSKLYAIVNDAKGRIVAKEAIKK